MKNQIPCFLASNSPSDLMQLWLIMSWLLMGAIVLIGLIWAWFHGKSAVERFTTLIARAKRKFDDLTVSRVVVYLVISLIVLSALLSVNTALGILRKLTLPE